MRRLLIRPGAIGDCILSFPALEFLRSDYTEVWVPTTVVPLVQFADRVCSISSTGLEVVGLDGVEVARTLCERLAGFDEVVSWYGTNRPEFRFAFSRLCQRCVFHEALPTSYTSVHAVDFFARQVGASSALVPRVTVHEGQRRRTVVMHPFSGSKRKNWPLTSYQLLSATLNLGVEWIAGPSEELPDAVRITDLLELATWIRGASLYVGNDSGITHLAAATGVRTLALFGPTSPQVWAPRGDDVTVIKRDPINDLPVATVLEAANRLLGSP